LIVGVCAAAGTRKAMSIATREVATFMIDLMVLQRRGGEQGSVGFLPRYSFAIVPVARPAVKDVASQPAA
jgi:hypothetical protein